MLMHDSDNSHQRSCVAHIKRSVTWNIWKQHKKAIG